MSKINKYVENINQCIKDGNATKIDINKRNDNFNNKVSYIPHHAVTNINKPGKICIVCDARAKCQNTSLNENLLKGPDLLNNLVGVLLRLRQGKFCVMADIKKMFHQVMVELRDRDALRFIWRSNRDENFQDIQMNIYLLGKDDSSCCCIWALNKTASDNIVKFVSRAEEGITDTFYVDDHLDSFHTVQEAIKVSNDVAKALSEGGFRLTKWVPNDQQILKALPSQEVSLTLIILHFDDISIERALGILYNPGTDALQIKVTAKDVPLTKRGILCYTTSIFDPLGILAPIILEPKLIIQSLRKQQNNCDSEIPTDLKQRFLLWKEKLQSWNAV